MIDPEGAPSGIWPIKLRSVHLARVGWTLWGTALVGDGEDWFLARLGRILLFDSRDALAGFASKSSTDHCFGTLPDWASLAREHLSDDVAEFDFDEDGLWLLDRPSMWDGPRRAGVCDRLNLFWAAANQFDEKAHVQELRGGRRGSLLGRLADALMESDEETLQNMTPADVRAVYRSHADTLFSRCAWVTD